MTRKQPPQFFSKNDKLSRSYRHSLSVSSVLSNKDILPFEEKDHKDLKDGDSLRRFFLICRKKGGHVSVEFPDGKITFGPSAMLFSSIEELLDTSYVNELNNSSSGERVDTKKQDILPAGVTDRLLMLEAYAKDHAGEGVADYAKSLFPELSAANFKSSQLDEPNAANLELIPSVAPEIWKDAKRPGETPPQFIKRIYGPWLGHGLTRADVRRLDEPLAQALYYHIRKMGVPPDFDLPSKPEQNTRWLEHIAQGESAGRGGKVDADAIREARRLDALQRTRKARTPGE